MNLFKTISQLFGSNKKQEMQPTKTVAPQKEFLVDSLTEKEKQYCTDAGLSFAIGLFLKKATNSSIEKLELFNEMDDTETPDNGPRAIAICSSTTDEKAKNIIAENLDRLIAENKYIFINELSYNDGYQLAIIGNTSSPYEIMEFMGTNGCNHDIFTEHIIAKYRKWDAEFGIKPIGIGSDFCECKIINKNINYKKLAEEVYTFCPDVVDQGTGTIEALAVELELSGTISLWWD
jgi:hypothetical protein